MKIVFLTGSHPRHSYIAQSLHKTGHLSGLIIEQRELHVPNPPENIDDDLKLLFNLHFKKRHDAEEKFFKKINFPQVSNISVSKHELNSLKTIEFIKGINPDLIMSYGVHKLSEELINACTGEAWNIHGGLSPWYRGVATHFWPSYFLEPQMTGMTIHDLTQDIDGGKIIHQNSASLHKGDGIHDLACRAVKELADELKVLIEVLIKGDIVKQAQKTTGKIWISKDWRPEHLRLIYEVYRDNIIDRVIEGKIQGKNPKIYRQF